MIHQHMHTYRYTRTVCTVSHTQQHTHIQYCTYTHRRYTPTPTCVHAFLCFDIINSLCVPQNTIKQNHISENPFTTSPMIKFIVVNIRASHQFFKLSGNYITDWESNAKWCMHISSYVPDLVWDTSGHWCWRDRIMYIFSQWTTTKSHESHS